MSNDKLPEGTLIKVSFEMRLPAAATASQINEWARYAVLQSGGCSLENPLIDESPDEWNLSFEWEDTGMIGIREEFDRVNHPGGGTSYMVRHKRIRRTEQVIPGRLGTGEPPTL